MLSSLNFHMQAKEIKIYVKVVKQKENAKYSERLVFSLNNKESENNKNINDDIIIDLDDIPEDDVTDKNDKLDFEFSLDTDNNSISEEEQKTDIEMTRHKQAITRNIRKKYLNDVGRYPLLSADEERRLFKIYHGSDPKVAQEAKEKLILSNLRLVIHFANKHHTELLAPEDLFQEGTIGLITAIEKFDVSKGLKLSTYATWWIRQAIIRAISDKERTIRIPVHLLEKKYRIEKAESALVSKLGRAPAVEDTAKYMLHQENPKNKKITKEILKNKIDEITKMKERTRRTASLDKTVGLDQDTSLIEFITDDDAKNPEHEAVASELSNQLNEILLNFSEREEFIIRARFGLPNVSGLMNDYPITHQMTLDEIGKVLGVTRERVRQIEDKALRRMKSPPYAKKLLPYTISGKG